MKSNLSRLFKGLLTGGLAFGSVLLQAEGYGLVLASDPHRQTVTFCAGDGKTCASGDLALHRILPLTPGGTYVLGFKEESDLEGSGSPLRGIRSPEGHNTWLGYLAEHGITLLFKRGAEFHPLPRCESGEDLALKERDGSMDPEPEVPVESKEAV